MEKTIFLRWKYVFIQTVWKTLKVHVEITFL